ncbi:putative ribosomal protein L24e/L24 superfamily [Helianthus anomalus]
MSMINFGVYRTELCRFSGQKIYPGRGIRFISSDSQIGLFEFRFSCLQIRKCKRYFHNKLKPSKLTWTAMYRKQHNKVSLISILHFFRAMNFPTIAVAAGDLQL